MRAAPIAVVAIFFSFMAQSQCLSDFTKLLPEKSPAAFDAYGQGVGIQGEYAVVGSPRNDSLGYNTGLVYIYKMISGQWTRQAVLSPPNPSQWLGFGHSVDITDDYIIVGATDEVSFSGPGSVYVFRKPGGGWVSTSSPVAILRVGTAKLGWSVRMTDDGNAIASGDINDPTFTSFGPHPTGAVYVFRKPSGEWNDVASYVKLTPEADKRHFYFGYTVDFDDNYLFVGAEHYGDHFGGIYIYKSNDGWTTFDKKVVLRSSLDPGYSSHIGEYMTASHNRVVAVGNVYPEGSYVFVFEKGTEWGGQETESYRVRLESAPNVGSSPMGITQTGDQIFVATQIGLSHEKYYVLKSQSGSFQVTPSIYPMASQAKTIGAFGTSLDTDGENVIIANPYDHVLKNAAGSAIIIPKGTGSFDPANLQRITDRPENTVDHLYGASILKKDDHLFVGSLRDSENAALGSVTIYKKSGINWVFQGKIAPPHELIPDSRFGASIAADESTLVVSAPNYNYEGAVFVYDRKTSWHDLQLRQIIRPFTKDGKKYQIGSEVAISGNTLVISSHEETTFTTSMLLYKRESGVFVLDQIISLGSSAAALRKEIDLSFYDETLAVGCITSNGSGNLLPGNVFFFEADASGKWDTVSMVHPYNEATNGFGYHVKLTEDHLFVADAGYWAGGVNGAGAILVYPRPRNGWASQPLINNFSGLITAANQRVGDVFGSDFDVTGNILIVGAQQSEILNNPIRENDTPGSAYIIQGLDFNWSSTIQLLRYEGEFRNHADKFGNAVHVDEVEFLVGAFKENQPDAVGSGAVYSIEMPPVVKLERPICLGDGIRQLKGYPFDGVWSGTGIVNPQQGFFDPVIAGVGTHLLTYKTPNCFYEGKLKIEVVEAPEAKWSKEETLFFCAQGDKKILLEAKPVINATYTWFFKPQQGTGFIPISIGGPSYIASLPGTYYVEIDNGVCASRTTDRILDIEKRSIVLPIVPVVCNTNPTPIQLVATPSGGVWSGTGVTNSGKFDLASPSNGINELVYTFTSEKGCVFTDTLRILVDILPTPVLISTGDFCLTGEGSLHVTNTYPAWYRYFQILPQPGPPVVIAEGQNIFSATVTSEGLYQVEISDEFCTAESNSVDILPASLRVKLSPTQNEILDICYLEEYPMEVLEVNPAYTYRWLFSEEPGGVTHEVFPEGNRYNVATTGYYQVEVSYGNCQLNSDWKHFKFTQPDSLYVPNVFTPNGDDKNSVFEVVFQEGSTRDFTMLEIFNRYGEKVHESTNTLRWDGDDFASGVYFWSVTYSNCSGKPYQYKGWVHLIR